MGKIREQSSACPPKKKKKNSSGYFDIIDDADRCICHILLKTPPSVGKSQGNSPQGSTTGSQSETSSNPQTGEGQSNDTDKERKENYYTVLLAGNGRRL